ncbi:FkbM family methyltransferase [Haladaptatus salinisoli]|uniref:FkbM family methyltransferase n=1 Tax=Haladaptatus salinisoli TaxID=2884876 RepID=UPI001D09A860|nr:FkbM family methyltransferase [Haladaptatus salinisoli]
MVDATKEPDVRTRVMNGVAVPSVEPEEGRDDHPDHERASIRSLRRLVRPGDSVVVVGGGWGVSTVVAARMTHFEGDVTTFEPTSRMLETIERTVEVNRVADLVTLEHAAIGEFAGEELWGEADGARRSPDAIPDCDVLELDCEGAELDILRSLEIDPRVIVVETHDHLGSPPEEVSAALDRLGYEVVAEGTAGFHDDLPVLTATKKGSR